METVKGYIIEAGPKAVNGKVAIEALCRVEDPESNHNGRTYKGTLWLDTRPMKEGAKSSMERTKETMHHAGFVSFGDESLRAQWFILSGKRNPLEFVLDTYVGRDGVERWQVKYVNIPRRLNTDPDSARQLDLLFGIAPSAPAVPSVASDDSDIPF